MDCALYGKGNGLVLSFLVSACLCLGYDVDVGGVVPFHSFLLENVDDVAFLLENVDDVAFLLEYSGDVAFPLEYSGDVPFLLE